MTYPNVPMKARLRIAPGASLTADPSTYTWTDISDRFDFSKEIVFQEGASDGESETASTFSCSLQNNDGYLTVGNAESALAPGWDVGCPIEYALDNGDGGGWRVQTIQYLSKAADTWGDAFTTVKCRTDIEATGLLTGRLSRASATSSPLRRNIPAVKARRGYWPMEDATGATSASSATSTATALTPRYGGLPFAFGESSPIAGAASVARIDAGMGMYADYTIPLTPSGFAHSFWMQATDVLPATIIFQRYFLAGGSLLYIDLMISDTSIQIKAYATTGAEVAAATLWAFSYHHWPEGTWVDIRFTQSGSTINYVLQSTRWFLAPDGTATNGAVAPSGSFTATLGTCTGIAITPALDGQDLLIGHLSGSTPSLPSAFGTAATIGWPGQKAGGRISALCVEAGIPVTVDVTKGVKMGAQLLTPTLGNLRDVASTDHGALSDRLGKISYKALSELYNLAPVITLSRTVRGELSKPFEPVTDDTTKANLVTTAKPSGTSASARNDADIAQFGVYEREPVTVNVSADVDLTSQAGWFLARGMAKGKRYATLNLNLLLAPQWSTAALALAQGDRIAASSLPSQQPKGAISRIVRGFTSTLGPGRMKWSVTLNLDPDDAYNTFVLQTTRLDTSGTEVIWPASSTATTLMVATAGALPITTALKPAAFPVALDVAGETVTLTANATEVYADPFTRTTSSSLGSAPASTNIPSLPWASTGGGGYTTADVNTTGTAATLRCTTANSSTSAWIDQLVLVNPDLTCTLTFGALATGSAFGSIQGHLLYRFSTGGPYIVQLEAFPDTTVFLKLYGPTTGTGSPVYSRQLPITHVAGNVYALRASPIGNTHRIKGWLVSSGEPTSWDVVFNSEKLSTGYCGIRAGRGSGNTNSPLTVTFDNFTAANFQAMTLTRSVNGVVRSPIVGNAVTLSPGRGLAL